MTPTATPHELYVGVDVGGTKILATLVDHAGVVLARKREVTPRKQTPEQTQATIIRVIRELLAAHAPADKGIKAIGIAIPGVVDPDEGRIILTPNMNLSGVALRAPLEKKFNVPVALGNDVNLGMLGEQWLGAAQAAQSAVGIFVGTGIGAGIIVNGRLLRGYRDAAGEVGHMVMQIGGPVCGCGNRGCLEALASRTAIEREIRAAIKAGRKSIVSKLVDGDLSVIRSAVLKRALKQEDAVVTEVMRTAAETLGYACLTIRHLLDPDLIVLGGGVIEACGDFMLPVIEQIVALHSLPGARDQQVIARSMLGDDAVALGAVALALERQSPAAQTPVPVSVPPPVAVVYPTLSSATGGRIMVNTRSFTTEFYIRADAIIKPRVKRRGTQPAAAAIGAKELRKICKAGPEVLFIGAGKAGTVSISGKGRLLLRERRIACEVLPAAEVIRLYNNESRRKALLMCVNT